MPALVRDKSGEVVYGLQAKDFIIEDDGVVQATHLDEAAQASVAGIRAANCCLLVHSSKYYVNVLRIPSVRSYDKKSYNGSSPLCEILAICRLSMDNISRERVASCRNDDFGGRSSLMRMLDGFDV